MTLQKRKEDKEMTETTRKAIENILSHINPDCFSSREIEGITFETFKKYVSVECYGYRIYHHEELSLQEICNELNEYAGRLWEEDLYPIGEGCTYTLENGKIYCNWSEPHTRYRVIGLKFSEAEV